MLYPTNPSFLWKNLSFPHNGNCTVMLTKTGTFCYSIKLNLCSTDLLEKAIIGMSEIYILYKHSNFNYLVHKSHPMFHLVCQMNNVEIYIL